MNPREPDHADALAELLRTTQFNLRQHAVQQAAFVAAARRDYTAGRKLHSLLAGRNMSEAERVQSSTASGRGWHGNSGPSVEPNERMNAATSRAPSGSSLDEVFSLFGGFAGAAFRLAGFSSSLGGAQ